MVEQFTDFQTDFLPIRSLHELNSVDLLWFMNASLGDSRFRTNAAAASRAQPARRQRVDSSAQKAVSKCLDDHPPATGW